MKSWLALLLIFQAKHFLADYPLQRRWMLGKFRDDWTFVGPLLGHVAVHGAFTFGIAWLCRNDAALALRLALFDMTVHFAMDRLKAGKRYLGRFKALTADTARAATPAQWRSNDYFWWSVGGDQMVHHLTHYAIIWELLR